MTLETIIAKLIEASPYLAFLLIYMYLESKREDKRIQQQSAEEARRVENAAALETRREKHEKEMQEKDLQHSRDVNNLMAGYIQQMVNEIKVGNVAIINKLQEHEEASEKRYERMGITKDLLKAATVERMRR